MKKLLFILPLLFSLNLFGQAVSPLDQSAGSFFPVKNVDTADAFYDGATKANQITGNGYLVDIKGYTDQLESYVDGLETLLGTTNTKLTALDDKFFEYQRLVTDSLTGTEEFEVDTHGMVSMRVIVSGTFTGNPNAYGSFNGTDYPSTAYIFCDFTDGTNGNNFDFPVPGQYSCDVTGYQKVKFSSFVLTGTADFLISLSPQPFGLPMTPNGYVNTQGFLYGNALGLGITETDFGSGVIGLDINLANPSIAVTGTFFQATQPVSAVALTNMDSKTPALGQATMAVSTPVVIASNQSAVTIAGTVTATDGSGPMTVDGTVAVTNADMTSTATNTGATATAVQVMDDWDESDRAKVNPIVGQAGVAAGAGSVSALTQRTTLASDDPAVASLGVIDDWDESDRAKTNPIVGQAGVQGGAGAVSANTQRVSFATDANTITIAAAQTLANVTTVGSITTLPALVASTANIGYTSDRRSVNPVFIVDIPNQVHVAAATTVHWDLFNADATRVIRVLSIRQIPDAVTAVTGVSTNWDLQRTTSVGTGGSTITPAPVDTSATALDSDVTIRSKPTGGAAVGTQLRDFTISSEETAAATIELFAMGGLELVDEPARIMNDGLGIVLRQNQGIRVLQSTNSNAGNTQWRIAFTQE